MHALAEMSIDMIRRRTRQGFGVRSFGGAKERLKPLSERYKEYRRENRRKLSPETSPGKSNLTFTGQMLDSMQIVSESKGIAKIGPYGQRRLGGGRNEDVAKWVEENGRPFLYLTGQESQRLESDLAQALERRLGKN